MSGHVVDRGQSYTGLKAREESAFRDCKVTLLIVTILHF